MRTTIVLLVCIITTFTVCKGQSQKMSDGNPMQVLGVTVGSQVSGLGKNIDCIFQDMKGNYWFASNGEGVYCYNGNSFLHFTGKDGLCSDYVWAIQEDINGLLWFTTRDVYVVLMVGSLQIIQILLRTPVLDR